VLTKADTPLAEDLARRVTLVNAELKQFRSAILPSLMVSSYTKAGMDDLRSALFGLCSRKQPEKTNSQTIASGIPGVIKSNPAADGPDQKEKKKRVWRDAVEWTGTPAKSAKGLSSKPAISDRKARVREMPEPAGDKPDTNLFAQKKEAETRRRIVRKFSAPGLEDMRRDVVRQLRSRGTK